MSKKSTRRFVLVLNICLIVALVGYIGFLHFRLNEEIAKEPAVPLVEGREYTEEEINVIMEQTEDTMCSVYTNLIVGSVARFSDGNVMKFLADGVFNGYFDKDNTAVADYTYVVSKTDDDYLADITIYNKNSSKMVQYKLMFDDASRFVLYSPADNSSVTLE